LAYGPSSGRGYAVDTVADVVVKVRLHGVGAVVECPWPAASTDLLFAAAPWRVFRWYRGQRHYSGAYWSATTREHVIYESRLELARLLFADFDRAVHGIVAQPFMLQSALAGKARKHVPDYLLITDHGPVIVDVKPLRRLSNSEVASPSTGPGRRWNLAAGNTRSGASRRRRSWRTPVLGGLPQGLALQQHGPDCITATPRAPGHRARDSLATRAVPALSLAHPAHRSRTAPAHRTHDPRRARHRRTRPVDPATRPRPSASASAARPRPEQHHRSGAPPGCARRDFSIARLARKLNTTTPHAIYLLSQHPVDWSPPRFRHTQHTATRIGQWHTWYEDDGLSLQDIADLEGTSLATVRLALLKFGVELRPAVSRLGRPRTRAAPVTRLPEASLEDWT